MTTVTSGRAAATGRRRADRPCLSTADQAPSSALHRLRTRARIPSCPAPASGSARHHRICAAPARGSTGTRDGARGHRDPGRYGGPMRAITITDDHTLALADVPEPVAAPGEVLVDVAAAGVNRAALAQVAGQYPPPAGASQLPGLEISGHRRDTGDAVVALLAGGGYAEVAAVPEGQLLPVPEGMDLIDAAGVVEVCATVVSNLVVEGALGEDE